MFMAKIYGKKRGKIGTTRDGFCVYKQKVFNYSDVHRGGGVLPIMAYTGRLRLKGVPFSGFRYIYIG